MHYPLGNFLVNLPHLLFAQVVAYIFAHMARTFTSKPILIFAGRKMTNGNAASHRLWLDRMASHLLAHARRSIPNDLDDLVALNDLAQAAYRSRMVLSKVPRPADPDPNVLAAKAAILTRLSEVLSAPPYNQRQQPPSWCADILPMEKPLWLMTPEFLGNARNRSMLRYGFLAAENFLFCV